MSREFTFREGALKALELIVEYKMSAEQIANRFNVAQLEDIQRELGVKVDRTEKQESKVARILEALNK